MRKSFLGLALVLSALSARAQTVTGSGTVGTVPQFASGSSIGKSPVSISGSNVGIGTTSPGYSLDLIGQIKTRLSTGDGIGILAGYNSSNQPWLQFGASDASARFKLQMNNVNSTTERLSFYAGPLNSIATNEAFVIAGNGNVGVGTISPQTILQLGALGANTNKLSMLGTLNFENIFLGHNNDKGGDALEFVNHGDINGSYGVKFLADNNTGGINGLQLQVAPYATSYSSLSYATALTILAANGAVGVGTTVPGAKLEVKVASS